MNLKSVNADEEITVKREDVKKQMSTLNFCINNIRNEEDVAYIEGRYETLRDLGMLDSTSETRRQIINIRKNIRQGGAR